MRVEPYAIDVPRPVIDDLAQRLARTRLADEEASDDWRYGTSASYLRSLVEYWRDDFDWYSQQDRLNTTFPQFLATIDGVRLHFIRVRGKGPDPFPIVLVHGWPSGQLEMTKLALLLSDPAAHGGDPRDSFEVIVPALPGFGFSGPQPAGYGYHRAATDLHRLMTEGLGMSRFGLHGTGLAPFVNGWIAFEHPEAVAGYHTHDPTAVPVGPPDARRRERAAAWSSEEGAYAELQRTKPMSIGHALTDSPAGLASWLVEKHRTWSDCHGDVERRYTKDELLTSFTTYWVTGTIASSMRAYYERVHCDPPLPNTPMPVPTGVAMPRYEPTFPPRWTTRDDVVAAGLHDLRHWVDLPSGGHFASWEEPALVAASIVDFFRPLRKT